MRTLSARRVLAEAGTQIFVDFPLAAWNSRRN